MTQIPEWLTTEENYQAGSDRDGFLNKSILSVLSVLHSFRDARMSYGRLGRAFPAPLKLLACLGLIITTSCLQNIFWLGVMLAVVLVHFCFVSSKQLVRTITTSLAAAIFTALIMLPAAFLGSPNSMVLISAKVFISVSLVGILGTTTEWNRITAGLRAFHVPEIFVFTLDITLKYIVILGDISIDMLNALKLRSVGKNKSKSDALSGVLGVTFLKSRQMADEMYDAMICRCYGERE